jgi:hypothetical protein
MPNRTQAHSWIPPGKKAIVRLKNGEMFIDKFRKTEKCRLYFDSRIVLLKDLQMMAIYRPIPERK